MRIRASQSSSLLLNGYAKVGFFAETARRKNFTRTLGHTSFNLNVNSITDNQKIVKKPLPVDLKQQGMMLLEQYKKSFNITNDKVLSPLRIYSRILKQSNGIRKDSFITFKPRINHTYWNQSPVLKKLIQQDMGQMGYGLALYNGKHKVWIAPYGNQLEFTQTLRTNYAPFIDLPKNHGVPHFVGFFPDLNYHQVYYYLGADASHVDPRLANLKPDYFGVSRTYDGNWDVVKENSYAIRVPFSNFANTGLHKFPTVPFLNISYRHQAGAERDAGEESVSYLCYKR